MKERHQHFICSMLILLTVITRNSCDKLPWGSPCKSHLQCRDGEMSSGFDPHRTLIDPIFGHDVFSMCKDSRCKCAEGSQSLEFKDSNYECIGILYGEHPECNVDDPETCVNGVCKEDILKQRCICNDGFVYAGYKCRETVTVDYSAACTTPKNGSVPLCDYDMLMRCNSTGKCGCFKDHFYDVENKTCISIDAYIEKYTEETIAGLDEFCGSISSNGLPKVCDVSTNMTCVSKKCKCTKEFYPSFDISFGENNTCESKASYVLENNLTSYKVMPGLYCYNDNDCITGLTCASNNECDCPHPCKYDNQTVACDCGAVSAMEGASSAVLVGVIGGIAIIVFWGHMIKKIIDKKPIHDKYYDEPVSTEHPTSVPFSAGPEPSPFPLYPVSPVSKREPSPVPPYPVSAPSDPSAPVGFSAPTAPPPDAAQQPPPYTSNATPYPTSPAPYTTNTTPYPTNPATVPGYSISNPTPYPTSTATAPDYSTSPSVNTGPGYPTSPYPGQTTGNSTDPAANVTNGTTYPLNPPSAPPAVDIYKPIIS